MKTEEEAIELAEAMVSRGKMAKKDITAIITDMNQPLGRYIGNGLEIIEVIKSLKGNGEKDVMDVVYALGTRMAIYAGVADNEDTAYKMLRKTIEDGSAYEKFIEFVKIQGGDVSYVENTDKLCDCKFIEELYLDKEGYISYIDTEKLGRAVQILGGGRETKDSQIDLKVGLVINKKIGEYVDAKTPVLTMFANDENKLANAKEILIKSICTDTSPCVEYSTIKSVI
jgi:pyrimidine-nucleoside phosphorylase